MAIRTVSQLKQWFRTGCKPLQSQFWDWLDSFRHKNDEILMNEVKGLLNALQDKVDKVYLESILQPETMDTFAYLTHRRHWMYINKVDCSKKSNQRSNNVKVLLIPSKLSINGNASINGTITTAAPLNGIAAPFKIGCVKTGDEFILQTNKFLEIESEGVVYKLPVVA